MALATYVLHEVKGHDIQCGGTSEFAIVSNTGETSIAQSAKIAINEDYAASFNEFTNKISYDVADVEKTDDEIFKAMAKTDEVLFLSLMARREKQEQQKLTESSQFKMSGGIKLSNNAKVETPNSPEP